ncbi:MAG: helix-turn-helix transcriptional regulator [Balneolaceae bacterium]
MKLGISNMVCPRCIESVKGILVDLGQPEAHVELGEVELENKLSEEKLKIFENRLKERGFELIFDRETELINLVKKTLINYLQYLEQEKQPVTLSNYVSDKTNYNYSYLSKVFSDRNGKTIESYLIELKIERVKELLGFKKYTLSEIAWKLKYSSVQYLSNQFKKSTGVTVTQYLVEKNIPRKSLDQI